MGRKVHVPGLASARRLRGGAQRGNAAGVVPADGYGLLAAVAFTARTCSKTLADVIESYLRAIEITEHRDGVLPDMPNTRSAMEVTLTQQCLPQRSCSA